MRLLNSNDHFGLFSKILHWSIAMSIFGLIGLGWYMVDLTYYDRWYNDSLSLHKSFGVVVFTLGAVMLVWKWLSPSPAIDAELPQWQRLAARLIQRVLLFLVITIPVTGFLISTSAGKPVSVFDWIEIPALVRVEGTWRDLVISAHYYLSYGVGILAAGHAAAALKHQFIDRDGMLARMLWR